MCAEQELACEMLSLVITSLQQKRWFPLAFLHIIHWRILLQPLFLVCFPYCGCG